MFVDDDETVGSRIAIICQAERSPYFTPGMVLQIRRLALKYPESWQKCEQFH